MAIHTIPVVQIPPSKRMPQASALLFPEKYTTVMHAKVHIADLATAHHHAAILATRKSFSRVFLHSHQH